MSEVEFLSLFETKSQRVKGLAFHPSRPWLLASLHTGVIQLWDYRLRVLLERYADHEGPVRSVDFHNTQSVFASGGDDYKVRVWAMKDGKGGATGRRPLAVLEGHVDYVRSVHFHPDQPWLLTASDDHTICIWNWQSRQLIATLSGHTHYVMSARWHATEDLIISASLDQTVRVWDYSALRRKAVLPRSTLSPHSAAAQAADEVQKIQDELFGTGDVTVKFVLEGHERGVNWASFHPLLSLAVSGSDDKTVRLWRMSESKAWEVDTLRGHQGNVSSAIFHPKLDLLLTNAEDKTIRIWDLTKRQVILTQRRDNDRFWALAVHPRLPLFAAAHDGGLVLFKLNRERPAYCLASSNILFAKDKWIRQAPIGQPNREVPLFPLRAPKSGISPKELHWSKDGSLIVTYSIPLEDQSSSLRYEVYSLPSSPVQDLAPLGSGSGLSVVWLRRQRLAVLIKPGLIHIISPQGEIIKRLPAPPQVNALLPGPPDQLLLRTEDRVILYDVQQERIIGEVKATHVKAAIWQEGGGMVALMSKGALLICSRSLDRLLLIPETLKLKSGVWDEQGTFLYSTHSHLKFALPPLPRQGGQGEQQGVKGGGGDQGIVRALDRPLYLVHALTQKAELLVLDRSSKLRLLPIDVTEYSFKRSLLMKKFDEVIKMLKSKALVGHALVGYLKKMGYPELALQFVQSPSIRFELALEAAHSQNLEIALQCAQTCNDPHLWRRLGEEALRQGNMEIREKSLQQTLLFDLLSFSSFLMGNDKSLLKLASIANEKRNDVSSHVMNCLLLGDIEGQISSLMRGGQGHLAWLMATTHGLTDLSQSILNKILPPDSPPPQPKGVSEDSRLLMPPLPLMKNEGPQQNWPHTRPSRGPFDSLLSQSGITQSSSSSSRLRAEEEEEEEMEVGGAWGDDLEEEEVFGEEKENEEEKEEEEKGEDGWGEDEGLDLDEELESTPPPSSETPLSLPPGGVLHSEKWSRGSSLAVDQVASGKFEVALRLLHDQIGLINPLPLKHLFSSIYRSRASLLPMVGGLPPLRSFLDRESSPPLPLLPLRLSGLLDLLGNGYKAFTAGKFTEAVDIFRNIITSIPLLTVETKSEEKEVRELLLLSRDYLLGLLMELKRKDLSQQPDQITRPLELACLWTHLPLQPRHQHLVLKLATTSSLKKGNYALAEDLAHRLLQLAPPQDLQEHCEKVLRLVEQKGRVDAHKLNYDSRNPFVICGGTFTPLWSGTPTETCPYCQASFVPQAKGRRCPLCQLSQIGLPATGLQLLSPRKQ